jgi:hypothetical protein
MEALERDVLMKAVAERRNANLQALVCVVLVFERCKKKKKH